MLVVGLVVIVWIATVSRTSRLGSYLGTRFKVWFRPFENGWYCWVAPRQPVVFVVVGGGSVPIRSLPCGGTGCVCHDLHRCYRHVRELHVLRMLCASDGRWLLVLWRRMRTTWSSSQGCLHCTGVFRVEPAVAVVSVVVVSSSSSSSSTSSG